MGHKAKRKAFHDKSPYCRKCGDLTILPNKESLKEDKKGNTQWNMATIQHNRFPDDPLYKTDITLWCRKCNHEDNREKHFKGLVVKHPVKEQPKLVESAIVVKQLEDALKPVKGKKKIKTGYYQINNRVFKYKKRNKQTSIVDMGNIIDFTFMRLRKYINKKYKIYDGVSEFPSFDKWNKDIIKQKIIVNVTDNSYKKEGQEA